MAHVNYSKYSMDELQDVLSKIDPSKSPENHTALMQEIEKRKMEAANIIEQSMVSTSPYLAGYTITKNLGVVRGISVRSRSVVGGFFAGLQSMFGGNISLYVELCEETRQQTYETMCQHARQLGANGIISMSYETNEIDNGITEVLCYGTAVIAEQESA